MREWRSARSKARAPDAQWSGLTIAAPSWPPKAPDEVEVPALPALPVEVTAEVAPEVTAEVAPEVTAEAPVKTAADMAMLATLEIQPQVLHLLDVVTTMCDHVIEYIEADRAERRLMIETLTQLGRVVTDRATAAAAAEAAPHAPLELRERVTGGSMPAGPVPVIDLRQREPEPEPGPESSDASVTTTEIAVEVRGRFGDRWVGGFEICEVMTTPDGPRYRLRRHRDGVVLPELFDATSIRHIETFDQLSDDQLNDSTGYWSRS
ncbi:MAG: hypothetical protein QOG50_3639 [Actinomycetota bacterium]|nr:hypothetical protein [Actinomycetota bacterium]